MQEIRVSISFSVPAKDFDYNAEVEIINAVIGTLTNANWYIKIDDIVLKNKYSVSIGNNKPVDSN